MDCSSLRFKIQKGVRKVKNYTEAPTNAMITARKITRLGRTTALRHPHCGMPGKAFELRLPRDAHVSLTATSFQPSFH